MAEERIFLDENGVKVTNARFQTYGKTHSIAGVTSVGSYVISPNRKPPLILAGIGLLCFIFSWIVAIIVIALAVVWWIMQKKKYSVELKSASGSEYALTSEDEAFIFRVVDALNEAIVYRG